MIYSAPGSTCAQRCEMEGYYQAMADFGLTGQHLLTEQSSSFTLGRLLARSQLARFPISTACSAQRRPGGGALLQCQSQVDPGAPAGGHRRRQRPRHRPAMTPSSPVSSPPQRPWVAKPPSCCWPASAASHQLTRCQDIRLLPLGEASAIPGHHGAFDRHDGALSPRRRPLAYAGSSIPLSGTDHAPRRTVESLPAARHLRSRLPWRARRLVHPDYCQEVNGERLDYPAFHQRIATLRAIWPGRASGCRHPGAGGAGALDPCGAGHPPGRRHLVCKVSSLFTLSRRSGSAIPTGDCLLAGGREDADIGSRC